MPAGAGPGLAGWLVTAMAVRTVLYDLAASLPTSCRRINSGILGRCGHNMALGGTPLYGGPAANGDHRDDGEREYDMTRLQCFAQHDGGTEQGQERLDQLDLADAGDAAQRHAPVPEEEPQEHREQAGVAEA